MYTDKEPTGFQKRFQNKDLSIEPASGSGLAPLPSMSVLPHQSCAPPPVRPYRHSVGETVAWVQDEDHGTEAKFMGWA